MATSLDLRNPQRAAARYIAWQAEGKQASRTHDTHTGVYRRSVGRGLLNVSFLLTNYGNAFSRK